MKIRIYLDECKKKLEISSTYALAKALEIDERRLHAFYKGIGSTNEYLCFKIAQILDLDPAFLIADIKSETEKDESKREFFKSIAGSLKKKAVSTMLALFCLINIYGGSFTNGAEALFKRKLKFV